MSSSSSRSINNNLLLLIGICGFFCLCFFTRCGLLSYYAPGVELAEEVGALRHVLIGQTHEEEHESARVPVFPKCAQSFMTLGHELDEGFDFWKV